MSPIFVIGRQHCGNTMVSAMLGMLPGVLAMIGEGLFFERLLEIERLPPHARVWRVANEIAGSQAPALGPEAVEAVVAALQRAVRERNDGESAPSATELYVCGMNALAAGLGKVRWVQKATSYIFYVESILSRLPNAKLVFLARNPFDIGASVKRRVGSKGLLRMVVGWNAALRRAAVYRERYPQNFLMVRYEDLAHSGASVVRRLCSFVGLQFQPQCLNVRRINRAERPYEVIGGAVGVSASRINYYRRVLSPGEIGIIRAGAAERLLRAVYPELRPPSARIGPVTLGTALGAAIVGVGVLVVHHVHLAVVSPVRMLHRIVVRLG